MPGDSFYWSPVEADSDDSVQSKEPYIDPWDLENYAYIREHLDSMELSSAPSALSGSSGEFAEANSNSFYYVPGEKRSYSTATYTKHPDEKRGYDSMLSDQENYAAIDEIRMNSRRRRSEMYQPERCRRLEEYELEIEEVNPYAESYIQERPVFGIYDEKGVFRRVALPITYPQNHQRDRSLSFAYGDYGYERGREPKYDPRYEQCSTRPEIYSRLDDYQDRDATLPIYDDVARNRKKPDNFGLSKYGHLKIDYSYSWNNLKKYMKYN